MNQPLSEASGPENRRELANHLGSEDPRYRSILGGYIPLEALWTEGSPAPVVFPSETSARWYVRTYREHLMANEAVLSHAGRLHFHPERFGEAARRIGLEIARGRR